LGLAGPTGVPQLLAVAGQEVRAAGGRSVGSAKGAEAPRAQRGPGTVEAPQPQGAPKGGCSGGAHHGLLGEGAEDGAGEGDDDGGRLDEGR
ncbi:hypothetical protein AS28_14234, partial [Pygoscelis adeliae]